MYTNSLHTDSTNPRLTDSTSTMNKNSLHSDSTSMINTNQQHADSASRQSIINENSPTTIVNKIPYLDEKMSSQLDTSLRPTDGSAEEAHSSFYLGTRVSPRPMTAAEDATQTVSCSPVYATGSKDQQTACYSRNCLFHNYSTAKNSEPLSTLKSQSSTVDLDEIANSSNTSSNSEMNTTFQDSSTALANANDNLEQVASRGSQANNSNWQASKESAATHSSPEKESQSQTLEFSTNKILTSALSELAPAINVGNDSHPSKQISMLPARQAKLDAARKIHHMSSNAASKAPPEGKVDGSIASATDAN